MSVRPETPRGTIATRTATVAAAVVVVIAVGNFLRVLASLGDPSSPTTGVGRVVSLSVCAVLLLAYLVLVLRAPTKPRWAYMVLLALMVFIGVGASFSGGESEGLQPGTGTVVGLLVTTAFLALPAVYMRLVTPKSALAQR